MVLLKFREAEVAGIHSVAEVAGEGGERRQESSPGSSLSTQLDAHWCVHARKKPKAGGESPLCGPQGTILRTPAGLERPCSQKPDWRTS